MTPAQLCWGVLVRPRSTIRALARSSTAGQGVLVAGGFGLLYSLAALLAHRAGYRPTGQVLRSVPPERYYLWESVFVVPVTMAWMGSFAWFVRRAAARCGGRGSAAADFTMLAATQVPPMVVSMWLPDVVLSLLRTERQRYLRLVRIYAPAAVIWAIGLSTCGIAATEGISHRRAFVVVLVGEAAGAVASGTVVLVR